MLLLELSGNYQFFKSDTAVVLAQKAITLAHQIHFTKGEIKALTRLGEVLRLQGEYPPALEAHLKALQLSRQTHNIIEEANTLSFILTDLEESLQKITHHGKRADSIVKGMLQHSKVSSGQKEPTDLNQLADEYLKLAYHGIRAKDQNFNADLRLNLDFSLKPVNIIQQDIGRVLLNLYNNALYAVQQKQKQTQTGNGYLPQVEVTTHTTNGKVELRVKDNGTGIPTEILNKIYQPFFTTKPTGEGTGLGLSLTYDIITKGHGGELSVLTEAGRFTEFTVSLPVDS
ncbi:hypothetical protein GCM10023189_56470 [Nibrella saemangeumensis]|uniref:histidine kinase n=1 Tax=Nibrella saemangeumensis TaxID=1084526 RepID=A0ABP8NPZ7_9BACT